MLASERAVTGGGTQPGWSLYRPAAVAFQRYRFIGEPIQETSPSILAVLATAAASALCIALILATSYRACRTGELMMRVGKAWELTLKRLPSDPPIHRLNRLRVEFPDNASTTVTVVRISEHPGQRGVGKLDVVPDNSYIHNSHPNERVRIFLPRRRIIAW